jgi:quercetin dioxygenase-like cupin family protein
MTGDPAEIIDLAALARGSAERKPAWKLQTEDLNLNLVVLDAGGEVAAHTNTEVDVLLVGIEGAGQVDIEGRVYTVGTGQALVVPKSARRSIRCEGARFAYLACHRRRSGLWPEGIPRGKAGS